MKKVGVAMKITGERLVSWHKSTTRKLGFSSASFLQSLLTASMIVIAAALLAVAAGVSMYYGHVPWYANLGTVLALEMLAAVSLVTMVIERTRMRAIRKTVEVAFVNHHVNNALAQIAMISEITDVSRHDFLLAEAVKRISEAIFRSSTESHLSTLSLDVDLDGKGLTHGRQERETKWLARLCQSRLA